MSTTTSRDDVPIGQEVKKALRRAQLKRPTPPKFQLTDYLWIVFIAAVPTALRFLPGMRPVPITIDENFGIHSVAVLAVFSGMANAVIPLTLYVTLLRNRDRPAGLITSLLCASSLILIRSADEAPSLCIYQIVLVGCYAYYVTHAYDKSAGFVFAGIAVGGILRLSVGQSWSHAHLLSLIAMGRNAFGNLWWFSIPFIGTLGTVEVRRKYGPIFIVALAYLLDLATFGGRSGPDDLLVITPFLYIIFGVGIARLIPAIAGDIPRISLRYTVAIIAVVSLTTVSFYQQWQQVKPLPARPRPVPVVTISVPAPVAVGPAPFQYQWSPLSVWRKAIKGN